MAGGVAVIWVRVVGDCCWAKDWVSDCFWAEEVVRSEERRVGKEC